MADATMDDAMADDVDMSVGLGADDGADCADSTAPMSTPAPAAALMTAPASGSGSVLDEFLPPQEEMVELIKPKATRRTRKSRGVGATSTPKQAAGRKRGGDEIEQKSQTAARGTRKSPVKGKRSTTTTTLKDVSGDGELLPKPAFFYVAFLPSEPGELVKGSALVIARSPDAARIAALQQSPYAPNHEGGDITGIHCEKISTGVPARYDASIPRPLPVDGILNDPTLQSLMYGSSRVFVYRSPPATGGMVTRVFFCVADSLETASEHFTALLGMFSNDFNPECISGPYVLHTPEEHTAPEVIFLT